MPKQLKEPFNKSEMYGDNSGRAGGGGQHQPQLYGGGGGGSPPLYGDGDPIVGQVVMPAPACSMTNDQLEEHLRQSDYGKNRGHYLCYFNEGMPPRCVTCNQPIGAHKNKESRTRTPIRRAPAAATGGVANTAAEETAPTVSCTLCKERDIAEGKLDEPEHVMAHVPLGQQVNTKDYQGTTNACGCWTLEPFNPPACEECGIQAKVSHPRMDAMRKADVQRWWSENEGLTFYKCTNNTYTSCYKKNGGKQSSGSPIRFDCDRIVCSKCVANGYHQKENSRFHHQDPAWRTSLYGCFGTPRLCFSGTFCYYCCDHPASMWEGNLDTFDTYHLTKHAISAPGANSTLFWLSPVFCWLYPLVVGSTDAMLLTIPQLQRHEREIRARFGVEPHSTAEMVCCRHCIYIRLLREAEARGYPQPTCCTMREDVPAVVAQYPPHPTVNSPTSSMLL